VRVTGAPGVKLALQFGAQLIPGGLEVMVALPAPVRLTASTGSRARLIVAEVSAVMVTVQVLLSAAHPGRLQLET